MTPGPGIFRTQLPEGFLSAGINCGVRRYRPDLGILISEVPSVCVGLFTQNAYKAAPVHYCQQILPANDIRAIVTNSGEANAATGPQGIVDNQAMADKVAESLGCQSHQVLTASTGVIGKALSIDKITQTIPRLIHGASNIAEKFAVAILTTDLVPKTVHKKIKLSQGEITITGICKGSGMIHPNMATMLAYILTDAKLDTDQAHSLLKETTDLSFNMISVDGEMSTNDSVFLFANGASHVSINTQDDHRLFKNALQDICILLAKSIARDGEGATKLIQVTVAGVSSYDLAKYAARMLVQSPLIKTAIHGESNNWGRVIARLGQAGISNRLIDKCSIKLQDHVIYADGKEKIVDEDHIAACMKHDSIHIHIDVNDGKCQAVAWGCDLSERYVTINAEYLS